MQHQDFEWFLSHYQDLFEEYGHTFLVIKNKKVLGAYDSYAQGVREAEKTEALGTFIVQECNGDPSAYTVKIGTCWLTDT